MDSSGPSCEHSELNPTEKISLLELGSESDKENEGEERRNPADVRREIPKLVTRLRATKERLRASEAALEIAKECVLKGRTRYQFELDRIKKIAKGKNITKKSQSAKIVKPIRAGQPNLKNRNYRDAESESCIKEQVQHNSKVKVLIERNGSNGCNNTFSE